MPTESEMKRAAQAYIDGLNARDADAVIALFAPDAEIEDPVGTPIRRGEEIAIFFRGAVTVEPRLELVAPIRGSHGDSVAFAFTVATRRKNGRFESNSIDVMHFDDDCKIVRLEGYWGPGDRQALDA